MKKIIFIFFLLYTVTLFSQEYNYYLNFDYTREMMKKVNLNDSNYIHTSFLPIRKSYIDEKLSGNFLLKNQFKSNFFISKKDKSYLISKIFFDDLIYIKQDNLTFAINPLFNISSSKIIDDEHKYWQNTRGFEIHGTLGKKISFYTDFFENQAYFIPYIDERVEQRYVVPGQGAWKIYGEDKMGKDYNYSSGYISFTPFSFFNIQLGHSKNFVGSGYRSLLLSDNTFSYPFLKFNFTKNKFQYNILYTEFQSFNTKYYFYHYKKHGTFLFFNYLPLPNVEIGFFEGIIWHTSDNLTYVNKFPLLFFVPLPIIREFVYGFNHENNILIGFNFRSKIYKYGDFYSQIAIDDFSAGNFHKRYAFQAGIKIYDIFADNINKQNLFFQFEYNYAKPYMYTNNNIYSAYTNMNESLASTLGAGYKEFLEIVSWRLYSFEISLQIDRILTSQDTINSNFGTDLLLSNNSATFKNSENYIGQGIKVDINLNKITLAYILNSKNNLQIFVETQRRKFESELTKDDLFFVSFGLKNRIKNYYSDY